jgi:predicted nucleic acid-binding protein
VLLYLLSDDSRKKSIAKTILADKPVISTQVLNEFSNVCLKKLKLQPELLITVLNTIEKHVTLVSFSSITIHQAIQLKQRYQLQYYDSLILATAIENNCDLLYSEDMQHGIIIEGRLKIVNPFMG